MIQGSLIHEGFVYITLPGEVSPVTAGKIQILDDEGDQAARFVYGKSYLARENAVEIDPLELPLGSQVIHSSAGLFPSLMDAGPDGWGRLVTEIARGPAGRDDFNYLVTAVGDPAGALSFGRISIPLIPVASGNPVSNLGFLQEMADAIWRQDRPRLADIAKRLPGETNDFVKRQALGTALGGERPKTVITDTKGHWIAKFSTPADSWNEVRIEAAMMALAKRCRIAVPEYRIEAIGGRDILLIKRFDRTELEHGIGKARQLSGQALCAKHFKERGLYTYVDLVEEVRRASSRPKEDARQLFRRIAFNGIIGNFGDHPRNHVLVASGMDWRLAPAFDLIPSDGLKAPVTMVLDSHQKEVNANALIASSGRFLLSAEEARHEVETLTEQIRWAWYDTATNIGVTEFDCMQMSERLRLGHF